MSKNKILKVTMWEKDISQEYLSEKVGLPRPLFSYFVNGQAIPTKSHRKKIAALLDKKEEELWPEEVAAV